MVPLGRAENWPFLHLFEHGCETCEHARGCEQLLLYSIFRFCCLALSSSVFLASNCEKCWGR